MFDFQFRFFPQLPELFSNVIECGPTLKNWQFLRCVGSPVPSYARPTTSSLLHTNKEHIPDNYLVDSAEATTYPFTAESSEDSESEKASSEVAKSVSTVYFVVF